MSSSQSPKLSQLRSLWKRKKKTLKLGITQTEFKYSTVLHT